ncbi:MAG: hypothetical protein K2H76_03000, partial [Muribaculaceae bacterium]|nr:hypothetical protein [Muribaculaceae bacterium]
STFFDSLPEFDTTIMIVNLLISSISLVLLVILIRRARKTDKLIEELKRLRIENFRDDATKSEINDSQAPTTLETDDESEYENK